MTTVDQNEIDKFAELHQEWWDKNGNLKTLHDINDARLNFVLKHTKLAGLKVLDMGCGGGILTEALAKAGALTTGVDLEANAINVAQKHAKENNLDIQYIHTAIEELDANYQFDVITCMEMLEHVPEPQKLLEKLCTYLKPDGLLFLSTINRTTKAYLHTIVGAEYLLKIIPQNTHEYQKYIKPSEMANMLRPMDLTMLDLKGLGYNPLTRNAWLQDDIEVNYLAVAQKA